MRKLLLLLTIILCASAATHAQRPDAKQTDNAFTFDATDARKVITRDIGGSLLLRVVKERSVNQEHFGWRVEVVRKPYRPSSRNLLYHSRRTLGAHPSQIYAWHVTQGHFPNTRELEVWGRPFTVRVELVEPHAEGNGADARFVSGQIRITWGRKQNQTHPTREEDTTRAPPPSHATKNRDPRRISINESRDEQPTRCSSLLGVSLMYGHERGFKTIWNLSSVVSVFRQQVRDGRREPPNVLRLSQESTHARA